MSEYVLARSETTQMGGRGQTTSRTPSPTTRTQTTGASSVRTDSTPGQRTVVQTTAEVTTTSRETTPEVTTTSTQTRPANTVTQKSYGSVGVQFSFTIQVLSISPVNPAGGSGLSCA